MPSKVVAAEPEPLDSQMDHGAMAMGMVTRNSQISVAHTTCYRWQMKYSFETRRTTEFLGPLFI